MKLGATAAYTYAFAGTKMTVDDYVASIATLGELGIGYFDLEILQAQHVPIYQIEENVRRLRDALTEHNVRVAGFTAWACLGDVHSADSNRHKRGYELFDEIAQIASGLGAEYIHLGSDMIQDYIVERHDVYETAPALTVAIPPDICFQKILDDYSGRLSRLAQIAADRGLKFALEPRANSMVCSADGFNDVHRRAGHDNLYCCLDVVHAAFHREDLALAIEKLGTRLLVLQICDAIPGEMVHYPLGDGVIDFAAALRALAKVKFSGYVNLEMYRGGEDDKVVVDNWYRRGAEAVRNALG